MNFKSQLEADIHAVFLNLDEFAERGELAGHEDVPMVVETLDMEATPSSADERVAVSYEGVTVYVSASVVPDEFMTGRKTTFRHERWYVLAASCDAGLKAVQLYRERS